MTLLAVHPIFRQGGGLCNDAICAWRSEITSAFAGVAKENANPKTITTVKRIAATFFVANALLIVNFDFFTP